MRPLSRRRSTSAGGPALAMVNVEMGSVYERGHDGRWVAILWREGKRKAFYGATKSEARANRRKAYQDAVHGLSPMPGRGRIATGDYLELWFSRYSPPAESTRVRARQHLNHAIPVIGSIPLDELSGDDLEALYEAKIERWSSTVDEYGKPCKTSPKDRGTLLGTSPMTTFNMHRVLFQALRAASHGRNRLLLHNPGEDAEPPYVPPRDLVFLDIDQTARLIAAAGDRRYGSMVITAVQVGAREGELLARQWKDYDPLSGAFHISTSKKRGKRIGPTKTRQSRRTLTLPAASRAALDADRSRLIRGGTYCETNLIWPAGDGGLLEPGHVLRGIFHPMLGAASCPIIRFHDLRHTAATLLLRTMQPHQVAEILGHTTAALVWKTYGHVIPKDLQKAVESMDALFPAPRESALLYLADTGHIPVPAAAVGAAPSEAPALAAV